MDGCQIDKRELARECVAGLYDVGERLDARFFIGAVSDNFRKISLAYRSFLKNNRLCKEGTASVSVLFSSETMLFLESVYRDVKKERSMIKGLVARDNAPRLFTAAKRFLKLSDRPIDDELCSLILLELSEGYSAVLSEYRSARVSVSAAFLCEYAELLSKVHLKECTQGFELKEISERLDLIVRGLRCVLRHSFSRDILQSRCAKILERDPSGVFCKMTEKSRLLYLELISKRAKKGDFSEVGYARTLLEAAKNATDIKKRHIGYPLLSTSKQFFCVYFLTSLLPFTLIALPLLFNLRVFLLSLLPLVTLFSSLFEYILRLISPMPSFPKMQVKNPDRDNGLIIVIPAVLHGENKDSELFECLETTYLSYKRENVYLGILADLPVSPLANAPGDNDILGYAFGRIKSLNVKYGERFFLLVRRRGYSKGEEAFMGRDGEWGAIVELTRLLKGGSESFEEKSLSLYREIVRDRKIKYVITLDRNSRPTPGAIEGLYGAMVHPFAFPRVCERRGIVTEGYGMLKPICTESFFCVGKNLFTSLMYGTGRAFKFRSCYSAGSTDTIRKKSLGNGIIDVDVFSRVLDSTFRPPEDMLLQHVPLMEAYLRCGTVTDAFFTVTSPVNRPSHLKRLCGEIKSDIQYFPFIFKSFIFDGKLIKSKISASSRLRFALRITAALTPIFSFIGILTSQFLPSPFASHLIFLSNLPTLTPFIFGIIHLISEFNYPSIVKGFTSRRILTDAVRIPFRCLYDISSLPITALTCLEAVVKGAYRLVFSHKGMIEQQRLDTNHTTSSVSLPYAAGLAFSIASAIFLLVKSSSFITHVISSLWLFFPITSYLMSLSKNDDDKCTRAEKDILTGYCADMWRFYRDFAKKDGNGLPPGSFRINNGEGILEAISPSDIGFYMMSVLAARDFGFIDTMELYHRIERTTKSINALQKHKGLLYSLYDTQSKSVASDGFISSAECGIFNACLMTVSEGLLEYASEKTELIELSGKIKRIYEKADFKLLYNSERGLFLKGITVNASGEEKESYDCYELLLGKTMITSFIQCAVGGIPVEHWYTSSRKLMLNINDKDTELLSGIERTYEYMLPSIFLPIYKHTHLYDTMRFSRRHYSQKDSPSSLFCFLSLCVERQTALSELEVLKKRGYYGKYGFCHSSLAYPLGISICCAANQVFDGIFTERFMKSEGLYHALELLCEPAL